MSRALLAVLLALPGCGGSTTVEVHAPGASLLAVAGSGAVFETVSLDDSGIHRFEADGRFAIARVCDGTIGTSVHVVRASADDGTLWRLSCTAPAVQARVAVESGDGSVITASCGTAFGQGASFELLIPPGRCDLVVTDEMPGGMATRILRRELAVEGDRELTIDIAEAQPLLVPEVEMFDHTGAEMTFGSLTSVLVTEGGTTVYLQRSNDGSAALAPAIPSGDLQVVRAADNYPSTYLAAARELDDDAVDALAQDPTISLTLPSPDGWDLGLELRGGFPAATFATRRVTRSTLQAAQQDGAAVRTLLAQTFPGWPGSGEIDAAELAFPDLSGVDGWEARWALGAGIATDWSLELVEDLDEGLTQIIGVDTTTTP